MKLSVKIISVFMALVLALSSVPAAAAKDGGELSDLPVIIVPGYTSSGLEKILEDGSTEKVWGVNVDNILSAVLRNIAEIALGLGLAASGSDPAYLAKIVGEESYPILDGVRCNPDGSSYYNVRRIYSEPEYTNNAYYLAHPEVESGIFEKDIMGDIAELIGPEKIFNFNTDFRMGAIACAEQLNEYVLKVLDYTGAEKVNIIAISHGGQVTGTYLSMHGTEGYVDNVVLIVPALRGAGIAYDFFNGEMDFDEDTLVRFVQHGFMSETDFNWLVRAEVTGFLDDVIRELIPYLLDSVLYWGSLWDFMPPEYYEDIKDKLLDKNASAELIEKSDRMHYEIMPNYAENFKRCREAGVNLNIIAGTDNPIVTGLKQNSDAIITAASSTGAVTAPFGKRFSDGYRGLGATCNISEHNHISPSFTVDGTTAYLPENTFYVQGLFHGMEYWDPYTAELLQILLLTDDITDVYSDKNFSQFHATTNPEQSVTAYFDSSEEGYVSSEDKYLIVKNLSSKYSVTVVSVDTAGLGMAVISTNGKIIKPGESAKLKITGKIPEASMKKAQVTVNYYTSVAAGTPLGSRTLSFILKNGAPVDYDENEPYAALNLSVSEFGDIAGDRAVSVLGKLGLLEFVEMVFDAFFTIFKNIVRIFEM